MNLSDSVIIGVASDTHSNRDLAERALDVMTDFKVERIYHLGDDYRDAEWFEQTGLPVVVVPGLYCPEYSQNSVPNTITEELTGRRHLLVHSEASIKKSELGNADVIFSGHTHKPRVEREGSIIYVNPGHLKDTTHRGGFASIAIVEATEANILIRVIDIITNEIILAETYS